MSNKEWYAKKRDEYFALYNEALSAGDIDKAQLLFKEYENYKTSA